MSEAVVVRGRDWLAELYGAIEVGETEALGMLIGSIAASAPELRNAVCKAVGELGDGWEKWAEDFFAKPKPKPKLIRRLLKLPSVQQNAPVAVGPSKIGEAQNVLEKAQPAPKPE